MKPDGSIKQEHILEAAIKRFSHFGISKTTLSEIADDLAISKPSLFYYFADKNGLVTAVAKKIVNEFVDQLEVALKAAPCVEDGLLRLVELKRDFYKKYFLLAVQGEGVDLAKVSPELTAVYQQAQKKTIVLLALLLQKEIEKGKVKPLNSRETSLILLDTLAAFEQCVKYQKRIPELSDFDELFNRQKEVLHMIVNGLKKAS
jgi:TetR/AcrR family transcriptional repressor of mexJK operon